MKTVLKYGATLLALSGMAGQALAAGVCARPGEEMALKTAAMQQELMVAALYCNDVAPYNHFVISYQKELQDSDAALLTYFQRADGRAGAAAYHSYKTALANTFSLDGLHGMQAYCAAAQMAFDAALNAAAPHALASFIATQSVPGTEEFVPCDTIVAGSEMVTGGSSQGQTRLAANRPN